MNRGLKRVCGSCGSKFYDMAKSPILCPKCGVEYTGEFRVRTRRARVAAALEDRAADVEIEEEVVTPEVEEEEVETVSLDEVVAEEEGDEEEIADDIDDLDDDLDDDDDDDDLDEDIDIDDDEEA